MKTGYSLIQAAIAATAFLAFAPLSEVAAAPAAGPKMSMQRLPPESLVLRSDVIADMDLTVTPDTTVGAIMASLTPEQKRRLEQIGLQIIGTNSLRIPDVQKELKMTTDQQRRLEAIADENLREVMRIRESDLDSDGISAAFDARRKKSSEESLAVLTGAQRAAWQEMQGKPFKQDMSLGLTMMAPPSSATPPPKEKPLLAIGTPAPDFEALTVDGKPVRLSDYRGKMVVLDFWATWCGPCIASMPSLNEAARRTQGQDVVFLALNVWDAAGEFKRWMGINTGLSLQFIRDPAGESREKGIASLFNVGGIPTTYVIDRDGKVAGTPKPAAMSNAMGGKGRAIPLSGKLDEELVQLLGKLGIQIE